MIDVVCAGLSVINFLVHPVDENIFLRDVTLVSPITLLQGGDAANQAIVLSRLGNKVALCSRRGNDEFGSLMLNLLAKHGIDIEVSGIIVDPTQATSVCSVMVRADGQRNFCVHRGAINNFRIEDIDISILKRTRVASIGGMFQLPSFDGEGMAKFLKYAKAQGVITVADTKADLRNIGIEGVSESLKYLDYFFPSYDEATVLSGESEPEKMAQIFLDAGVVHAGIKLGENGCFMKDAWQEFYIPGMSVDVVDTTGAGDNFMAGFITGLLRGWDIRKCCEFATAVGAICVTQIGSNSAVMNFQQVENFMRQL